ncbi:ABC transporter C family member 3-like isoform X1 [Glycine soja]|uniref:ABC-type xenobiotic transporter n=1 Tax=Glycine soja TaxID=3848 RepID=A0A445JN72_GLYSO|nr:ABC transporter C family member 3-like isoform X1 [Glycine soja]RZB99916.1 ABC transporter C family member 3 isoform A [Glycine soja]
MFFLFSHYYSSMMHHGTDFLLQPIFTRGVSASLNLVLLLVLVVYWVWKKVQVDHREKSERKGFRNAGFLYYKHSLVCSLVICVFNLVLCLLSYFYLYNNYGSEELVTLTDLALKTIVWGAVCAYLHSRNSEAQDPSLPRMLRIWWWVYAFVCCSCLVIDFVVYAKHIFLPVMYLVYDIGSSITSLFLCYVGSLGCSVNSMAKLAPLEEPLLNGDSNVSNNSVPIKARGNENLTWYSNAGFFSILTFSWISPLITLGNEKTLEHEDLPHLATDDSVAGIFPTLRNKLESECGSVRNVTTLKLVKVLFLSTWQGILLSGLLEFLYSCASYVGPFLIDILVQYLNGEHKFKNEGYVLAMAFVAAKLLECVSQRHCMFRFQQVGVSVQSKLVAMIYAKGLTLSCQSKEVRSTGEIINLMTVDAERIGEFCWYMHDPWMCVLQVALALLILYRSVGVASIAALAATVTVMLLNLPLSSLQEKFQGKVMEFKDKRMKATSEILKNMRILKLQAWEMKFLSKVIQLRKTEEIWLHKFLAGTAIIRFLFTNAPTFIAVVTFGACVLMGIPLESGKVLSALATFRILQMPIYNLPDTISMITQTKVSLDRIASFLRLDELQTDVIEKLPWGSSDKAIELVDGNFSWDLSSPITTLKNINLKVFHGMRVAVCGTVGSGKSSLLSCIIGEVPKISGTLKICGTKAYVSQSPWIQGGKIEDNILFGKEMDREKYEKILEACSLTKDLEVLPFGDQTIIGEKGINLSGGQKQRVQIARALYQDADIYLFDDPFSAVDAHTGSHLFKECLLGILKSKTVIYITHQVEFLPDADLILVMRDGRITQSGNYNDILKTGTDFMALVGAHRAALSSIKSLERRPTFKTSSTTKEDTKSLSKIYDQKSDDTIEAKRQLVQEEKREKGRVGFNIYWKYITTAYGGALVPFILLSQTLTVGFQIASNYWMTVATPVSATAEPDIGSFTLMVVYVALAIGSSIFTFARAFLAVIAGYKTATVLFNKMHLCIFQAPISFFDATPSGRILNRASTDQSALDMKIANILWAITLNLVQLLGNVVVMSQAAWQVFIVLIPVMAACIWYQRYYSASARELARLVGTCQAPVIQHFSETISGSTTIRSFEQESRFNDINMKLIDRYSQPKLYSATAMAWLIFRLDILSTLTFAFCLVFLITFPNSMTAPGIAGLAVTYGLNLNAVQTKAILFLCNLENKIISVERMLQYTTLPSEAPFVIKDNQPDYSWPLFGEVHIRDLQVRYAPHLPIVLRGLTCTFTAGAKTGIVGRTGSGKSTLVQTLFRLIEPVAGEILIDNINISLIGIHDLRSRLSIIPQEPTMFEGTVRTNLDPLEEYTDEQIWEALDMCQLGDEVRRKEEKLDSIVMQNGENWSMGQRQLVCLGRVLLKKSKILVLDEATASVDTATDNIIQQTVTQHFSECTVITIAHRITSILESDMVLFLNQGLIEEYDSPKKLLKNKSSSLAQLVAEYTRRSNSGFGN